MLVAVIGAIQWSVEDAVAHGRERTSVLSLSLTVSLGAIDKAAVVEAHRRGVVVVAAAGNAAYDQCEWSYLFGFIPEVILVGSTARDDRVSSFSNFGKCVDLFAPGSGVEAAAVASDTASVYMSGTSMATPHVSGAVALIRTMRPTLDADAVSRILLCTSTPNVVSGLPPSFDETARTPNRFLWAGAPLEDESHLECAFPPMQPPPPASSPLPPFQPYQRPCKCTGLWPCYVEASDSCVGGSPELHGANSTTIIAYCLRSGATPCLRQMIEPPPEPPAPPAPSPSPPPPPPSPHPPGYTSTCPQASAYGQPICTCERIHTQGSPRDACICGYGDPGPDGCCNVGCGFCGESELSLDCGNRPPLPPITPPPPPRPPGFTATCAAAAAYSQDICTCARVPTGRGGTLRDACICGFNPNAAWPGGCCNVGCGECGEGDLALHCGERAPLPPTPPPAPPRLPGAGCCASSSRFRGGWMTTANCGGTSDPVYLEGGHQQCRYMSDPWSDPRCLASCAQCGDSAHCFVGPLTPPPHLPLLLSPAPPPHPSPVANLCDAPSAGLGGIGHAAFCALCQPCSAYCPGCSS